MTIAIACNLSDGIVLGADSAMTMTDKDGKPQLVLNDGEKLFTLWDKPIGMVHYGMSLLRNRTVRSHVREFEVTHQHLAGGSVEEVTRALFDFMHAVYVGELAKLTEPLPVEHRAALGLLVGGFSPGAYLSEVWELAVHQDDTTEGVKQVFSPGVFNVAWRGMTDGIERFHNGVPLYHAEQLAKIMMDHFGIEDLEPDLAQKLLDYIQASALPIPLWAMPLQEGVHYVRFLLDIMINQSRFSPGSTGCGGSVRLAVVHSDRVEWVTDSKFKLSH